MNSTQEARQMITTGIIRWLRFPLFILAFFMGFQLFQFDEWWIHYLTAFLVVSFFGYWLWKRRRLTHDNQNLYIKRGNEEISVPLATIQSIKRSAAKVNGQRYWILIYLDEVKETQKLRFDSDFNTPFFDAVRKNNPEVVIWEHPFFNH